LANEGQTREDIIIENENNCMLRERNKAKVKCVLSKENAGITNRENNGGKILLNVILY